MEQTKAIEQLVVDASIDPLNPEKNFWIAVEYEKLGQTASAVSFYLRAAEYGVDSHPLIVYSALLKISSCLESQNNRNLTVSSGILQAMAYLPERPEAYFLYSKFNEHQKNWQECYTFAVSGLNLAMTSQPLPVDVGYPGLYGLEFEKAVSGWWIGRHDESKKIFTDLDSRDGISPSFKIAIKNNLKLFDFTDEVDPLEPVVTNYRKFFGSTASLVIDIGTRDGDDANYLASKLHAKTVVAIDAGPRAVRITKEKYPWMDVREHAVSNFNGNVVFYELDSGNKELDGCSSIALKGDAPVQNSKKNKITAKCLRMDAIIDDGIIDVVKIDTEGFTWQVLDGFGEKLKNVKLFHLETERKSFHDDHRLVDEVTKFMQDKGFYLADISYEWGWGIQDQVWINKTLATKNSECFRD